MNDTQTNLIQVAVGLLWLACVVISILKSKLWSAIIGVISAVAMSVGWTIGGWYILNPFVWVPVFAALRLARPDSYWGYWFYRNHPQKYARAILKYNMMPECLELQRRAENVSVVQQLNQLSTSTPASPAAFEAASDAYGTELSAIDVYTSRANHRYSILQAKRTLHGAEEPDFDAYEQTIAEFSDPFDHQPYTAAELCAHTSRIDALRAAFVRLRTAYSALDPSLDIHPAATGLYKACCDNHTYATRAYAYATRCAMTTALEAQLQAAKDTFRIGLLPTSGASPAKGVAAKAELDKQTREAKALEAEAKSAETKAETFLDEAESFQAQFQETRGDVT